MDDRSDDRTAERFRSVVAQRIDRAAHREGPVKFDWRRLSGTHARQLAAHTRIAFNPVNYYGSPPAVPNSKLELEEDVKFIFLEAARFARMVHEWAESRSFPEDLRDGFNFEMDFPDDTRRKLHLGRAAMRRLEDLANMASHRARIHRQVDVLSVREPLGQSFIRRFILENRPITLQQIERAMSEATRRARRQLRTTTHYLPCQLMIAQEPSRFALGPVSFLRRAEFKRLLATQLWESRKQYRPDVLLLREAARYYKMFSWVAEVTVPDCDAETSKRVAKQAVTAALNCLHLLFGAGHTREMTIGGPAIQRDNRAAVKLEGGKLSFMASFGGPGAVGFNEDWLKLLQEPQGQMTSALCGIALEAAVDPTITRPFSERFLDAAYWFGEAVREQSPAAKVIKYVTALERMFMTDEKDNIADTVAERIATFCFETPEDFDRIRREVLRAYDLRSKLAHGSMSPTDQAAYEGVRIGAELGRQAILSGLANFGPAGLRGGGTQSQIAGWFRSCVYQAEQMLAQANP